MGGTNMGHPVACLRSYVPDRTANLVGQRVDLFVWQPDVREPPLLGGRAYPAALRSSGNTLQFERSR